MQPGSMWLVVRDSYEGPSIEDEGTRVFDCKEAAHEYAAAHNCDRGMVYCGWEVYEVKRG